MCRPCSQDVARGPVLYRPFPEALSQHPLLAAPRSGSKPVAFNGLTPSYLSHVHYVLPMAHFVRTRPRRAPREGLGVGSPRSRCHPPLTLSQAQARLTPPLLGVLESPGLGEAFVLHLGRAEKVRLRAVSWPVRLRQPLDPELRAKLTALFRRVDGWRSFGRAVSVYAEPSEDSTLSYLFYKHRHLIGHVPRSVPWLPWDTSSIDRRPINVLAVQRELGEWLDKARRFGAALKAPGKPIYGADIDKSTQCEPALLPRKPPAEDLHIFAVVAGDRVRFSRLFPFKYQLHGPFAWQLHGMIVSVKGAGSSELAVRWHDGSLLRITGGKGGSHDLVYL